MGFLAQLLPKSGVNLRMFPRFLMPGLFLASASFAAETQPNVLFIAVDDLRVSLGCYGDPLAQSPAIDRFASTARRFDRAYTQQAVCGPSRAALLTGRLPDNTGVWHNRNRFRDKLPDLVTLPQLFKNSGYTAVSLGKVFSGRQEECDPVSWSEPEMRSQPGWKNRLDSEADGKGKGRAWEAPDVPDDAYKDGQLALLAVEKLRALKEAGKPFFLAVGFSKPHLPFNAPKRYWDLYDPADFELDGAQERVRGVSEYAYHSHRELGGYRGVPEDEEVDAATARTLRHGYYACVSYVDAQIGKVLAALEDLGLADDTIVVLWGDHGWSLGEKNRWGKGTNFERDTQVPLIVRVPGLSRPGVRTPRLVETVDLYPTLAELAALPAPPDLDGRSFVPMLKDPLAPGRDAVLSQFARPFSPSPPELMGYSLRTPGHRYTRWVEWPGRQTVAEELYDYSGGESTGRSGAMLVEHANIAGDPQQATVLENLSRQLDTMLEQRTGAASPAKDARPPSAKKP
jgi:iduronate 2-sulfatase